MRLIVAVQNQGISEIGRELPDFCGGAAYRLRLCCNCVKPRPELKKSQKNFLDDLSNSNPAVRLYREGRAENRLMDY
jgi:hypothetical protein